MAQNPGQEQEIQTEPFFKDIELYEIVKSDIHPGVKKLAKILKYISSDVDEIKYRVFPYHVVVNIKNAEMEMKPWGDVKISGQIFEIEIYWWEEKGKGTMLTSIDISTSTTDISIGFFGYVKIKTNNNRILLDIVPKSKIHIL